MPNLLGLFNKLPQYRLTDDPDYVRSFVHITSGRYKNTVIAFGKVSFNEETISMDYDFKIVDNPRNIDSQSSRFLKTVSAILKDVMEKSYLKGNNEF